MKTRTFLIAAALVPTFAAGTSAAYLSEDIYGTTRLPATAMKAEEGVPRDLIALGIDEPLRATRRPMETTATMPTT